MEQQSDSMQPREVRQYAAKGGQTVCSQGRSHSMQPREVTQYAAKGGHTVCSQGRSDSMQPREVCHSFFFLFHWQEQYDMHRLYASIIHQHFFLTISCEGSMESKHSKIEIKKEKKKRKKTRITMSLITEMASDEIATCAKFRIVNSTQFLKT